MVNYRLSTIVSSGLDVATHLKMAYTHVNSEEYKQAFVALYSATNHGIRCAILISPVGLELHVFSISLQILFELGTTYSEWKQGRYIETAANFALASLRMYKLSPQLTQLQEKWLPSPSLQYVPGNDTTDSNVQRDKNGKGIRPNHCSGQLPDEFPDPNTPEGRWFDLKCSTQLVPLIKEARKNLESKGIKKQFPNLYLAGKCYFDALERIPSRTVTPSKIIEYKEDFKKEAEIVARATGMPVALIDRL